MLIEFHNPLTAQEIEDEKTTRTADVNVRVSWTKTSVPNDFDLFLYESDANGALGALIDSAQQDYNTVVQAVPHTVVTTVEQPSVYLLAHVVNWSVVDIPYNGSGTILNSVTT